MKNDVSRRPVQTAVFAYDCSRLLFLVSLLGAYLARNPLNGPFHGTGSLFPYMLLAAPNALFPLMSFFLLIRFDVSRAYIPLYICGKILCVLCLFLWLGLVFYSLGPAGLDRLKDLSTVWIIFVGAADMGSILGISRLNEKQPEGGE